MKEFQEKDLNVLQERLGEAKAAKWVELANEGKIEEALLEMLSEAGFKSTVYWEQADEDGEGNGEFLPQTEGEADAGWIAYIVSQK